MKRVHKIERFNSRFYGWVVRPICRVDNKTLCYKKTTNWLEVTCKRCIAKRG